MAASLLDYGPDSGGRCKGLQIVKTFVHGNSARYFGKNTEGHTHKWTVYVRSCENDDMSGFIKKVHFKLHDSYVQPTRVVMNPPYEVTETGWGEFEITIKIFFKCPLEKPVQFNHHLKLFKVGPELEGADFGVVSEIYDEMIFQDPTQLMKTFLDIYHPLPSSYVFETNFAEKIEKTLQGIGKARGKVKSEIADLRDKLKAAKEEIIRYKKEIAKAKTEKIKPV